MTSLDLFTPNSIEKLELLDADVTLYSAFYSPDEADTLFSNLLTQTPWEQRDITVYDKVVYKEPRLTAWYGDEGRSYSYSGIHLTPLPWTPLLIQIKAKIEAQTDHVFNSVLLNLYRNGSDSVNWHSDNEKGLGVNPVIASLSLGETRRFLMRHKHYKTMRNTTLRLTHGSLLVMAGSTQSRWEHSVPKTVQGIGPRINLTFRHIV